MTPTPFGLYVLDPAGEPAPEPDLLRWSDWMDGHGFRCLVAQSTVGVPSPRLGRMLTPAVVSTVFVGVAPFLYETFVCGSRAPRRRYATRQDALAGHQAVVEVVHRSGTKKGVSP